MVSYREDMSLKVWIDVLTPKQTLFFAPLAGMLKADRHEVLITTRVYREAQQALRFVKLAHQVVGRHGGGSAFGKLVESGKRVVELARVVGKWAPDVSVSFSSPEAARVSFGLGIPHVAANDSPHSWRVARLSVPLSEFICSPWIIKPSIWKAFGARRIVRYRALDPAAWLKRHKASPRVLDALGLDHKTPIIFLRTEEAFASYLMGKASDRAPVVVPVIKELLKERMELQIVVSTRYGLQAPVIRRKFGGKVVVLDRIVDATSLISYASVFIGSGGTMTVEAALLGTPAISCFPGEKPLYIKYLEKRGLVETFHSPRRITSIVRNILRNPDSFEAQSRKGRNLLDWMEDPTAKIFSTVTQTGTR